MAIMYYPTLKNIYILQEYLYLEKLNPGWSNGLTSNEIKIKPKVSQIRPKTWKIIILKNNDKLLHTMNKK